MKSYLNLLRNVSVWSDSQILPGDHWEKVTQSELQSADVVLILLSEDALDSEWMEKQTRRALKEDKRVVPIIIKPSAWMEKSIYKHLAALPTNGKPVSTFGDREEAYLDITNALTELANDIRDERESQPKHH